MNNHDITQYDEGEDVTDEFETPQRPSGIVVSVRLNPEDAKGLMAAASERGKTISQVAREAIKTFVAFAQQKPEQEVTIATDDMMGLIVRTSGRGVQTQGFTGVRLTTDNREVILMAT